MNLLYYKCPICQQDTIENATSVYCGDDTPDIPLYELHYHYIKKQQSAYFHITRDINVFYDTFPRYTTEVAMPIVNTLESFPVWKTVFVVNQHIELDFSDLKKVIQKIKTMVIFS
jgi:hypothetical protein